MLLFRELYDETCLYCLFLQLLVNVYSHELSLSGILLFALSERAKKRIRRRGKSDESEFADRGSIDETISGDNFLNQGFEKTMWYKDPEGKEAKDRER